MCSLIQLYRPTLETENVRQLVMASGKILSQLIIEPSPQEKKLQHKVFLFPVITAL